MTHKIRSYAGKHDTPICNISGKWSDLCTSIPSSTEILQQSFNTVSKIWKINHRILAQATYIGCRYSDNRTIFCVQIKWLCSTRHLVKQYPIISDGGMKGDVRLHCIILMWEVATQSLLITRFTCRTRIKNNVRSAKTQGEGIEPLTNWITTNSKHFTVISSDFMVKNIHPALSPQLPIWVQVIKYTKSRRKIIIFSVHKISIRYSDS